MDYNPSQIEAKWRKNWVDNNTYKVTIDESKPKFYVLDMFPYPSGSGLHVGHPLGYIASDIYARFKKLSGFNVLHPMGYDAFGLPAEQYAIQTGVHPADSTAKNVLRYREQLDNLGLNYDWSRSVKTCDPSYYKWTQWIFLKLYDHYYDTAQNQAKPISDLLQVFNESGNQNVKATTTQEDIFTSEEWKRMDAATKESVLTNYRLAYRKEGFVNWCEALGTVLANDEVKDGLSERGGHPVERRAMLQWSLRITAYAQRLLDGLDTVEFSESLKAMQRNWIGRSEGAQVFFKLNDSDESIEIFTTRPDTIFGATYMVLAPEHDLVKSITSAEQQEAVDEYLKYVSSRSERDRMAETKSITGVFTGAYAINPMTEQKIPIWLGEYVLKDYGTGAIMAVPSDDERDHAFATHFDLDIIQVVDKSAHPDASKKDKVGKMINSGFINGMEVTKAIEAVTQKLEDSNIGSRQVNFKLRDANFSRQRYWGEPFPILFGDDGSVHKVPVDELPVTLPPQDDFKPAAGGASPLARNTAWVEEVDGYKRETDTMPGYAGSSWYYLRYMDANNDEEFASGKALSYWKDVDVYIGGTEHAVGHLLYSRFWHKFLHDKGLVETEEPYKKIINQGKIQGIIEYIYLLKNKVDGYNKFMCSKLADNQGLDYAKIPIHIDFVKEYGTDNSYIDIDSIKKFIDWRPEYKDAIFECAKGSYHKGNFSSNGDAVDSYLLTGSELGKMSKSKFNVINPDNVIDKYGADCFRMYEMFLGPLEASKPWDTKGIDGVIKFLRKYWGLFYKDGNWEISEEEPTAEARKILHKTLKKVSENIERFSFNTCVAEFMICVNELKKLGVNHREILDALTRAMAPFAPFITEEIWSLLGNDSSIHHATFPAFNSEFIKEDSISYPLCINGKKRAVMDFPVDAAKEEMEKAALGAEEIQKWLEGKQVRKVIVVPKRMINIVVG